MDDYISRQAAIDALGDMPEGDDDFDTGCRQQWNWDTEAIKALPSAQPEVIRCKDCKWKQGSECVRFADVRPFPDDYCSRAERKEA